MTLRRPSALVSELVDRKAARLPHPKPGRVEGRNTDGTTRLRYLDGSCGVRLGITGARTGEVVLATPGVLSSRGTAGVALAGLAVSRGMLWLEKLEPRVLCIGSELVTVTAHGRGFTTATRFELLLADASQINPFVHVIERRFVDAERVEIDLRVDADAPEIELGAVAYGERLEQVKTDAYEVRACFGTITVINHVVNDGGGTLGVEDFPLFVDSTPVSSGVPTTFPIGDYTVSQQDQPGYSASPWSGDCEPDGSLTLGPGESKVCEITNDDDVAPLEIIKVLSCDAFGCSGGNQPLPHIKVTAGEPPLIAVGHRLEIYLNGDIQVGDQLRFTIVNSEDLFWSNPGTSKVTTRTVFAIRGPEINSYCFDPGPPTSGFVHWEEMIGGDFLNVETGVPQDTIVLLKVENLRTGESDEKDVLTVKGFGPPETC